MRSVCLRQNVCCGTFQEVYSVSTPVAFGELRLTGRENATNPQKKFWMTVRGRGPHRECFLEVSYAGFSEQVLVLKELLHR